MLRRLVAAVLCILSSKVIGLAVPFLFKKMVDVLMQQAAALNAGQLQRTSLAAKKATRFVFSIIFLHALAKVLASAAHELRNGIFSKGGQRIGRSITAASFSHIHSLEQAFHNSTQTGALTRVVDRGTRSIMTLFRSLLFAFLPTLFELFLVCVVLFRNFSPLYVAVTVTTFVCFLAWTFYINDELGRVRAELNQCENEASAKLTDSLMNIEAVKAFDNADLESSRYDRSLAKYEHTAIRNEWLYAFLNIGQGVIFTTGLTSVFCLAANGVMSGRLTVGSVVMLATMLQQLWVPLNFLGWQYREVKQSLIDMSNLFEILQRQSKIQDMQGATDLKVTGGEISFENVSFTYPEAEESSLLTNRSFSKSSTAAGGKNKNGVPKRQQAISNLSFTVPAGKSVALVGSSGSGKSTTIRLLYRLYDISGGRILVDGQDISKATLSSLRKAMSIVPQVSLRCLMKGIV